MSETAEILGFEMDEKMPEGLISRVIVILEVIDSEDSEPALQVLTSNLTPWDASGMIRGAQIAADMDFKDAWRGDE